MRPEELLATVLPLVLSDHLRPLIVIILSIVWLFKKHNAYASTSRQLLSFFGKHVVLRGRIVHKNFDTVSHMSCEMKAVLFYLSENICELKGVKNIETLVIGHIDRYDIKTENRDNELLAPVQSAWVRVGDRGIKACVSTETKRGSDRRDMDAETLVVVTLKAGRGGYSDLVAFIDSCVKAYERYKVRDCERQNIFIFRGYVEGKVSFDRVPFSSRKTFDNMVFVNKEELVRRIVEFESAEGRARSDRIGKQHALGMVFRGPPGCGKTSCIKAVANLTGRHVIIIRMDAILTRNVDECTEVIKAIMISPKIGDAEVPVERRLYVFEEADTWQDLLSRPPQQQQQPAPAGPATKPRKGGGPQSMQHVLGALLELMDGIVEMPGRMCIMTTNHPDRLDAALLRPGRFGDVDIEFLPYTRDEVAEMYRVWFGRDLPSEVYADLRDGALTQADLGQIFECADHDDLLRRLRAACVL